METLSMNRISKNGSSHLTERKGAVVIALTIFILFSAWLLWPSSKPPEPCPNGMRPGQILQDFDNETGEPVRRIMGDNCEPSAEAATPEEIEAAEERMAEWQQYEAKKAEEHAEDAAVAGYIWAKPLAWMTGGIGLFVLAIFGIWVVLIAIALAIFFIGFAVVSVVGIRHAPLFVVLAPVMFWWKVLIEIPKQLIWQMVDVAESKEEARQINGKGWQALLELLGLRKHQGARPSGNLGSATFATANDVRAKDSPSARRAPISIGKIDDQKMLWHTDKHVLILAGTRAGKGRDIIIPNLLSYEGSVLVVDPKAENFVKTGRYRATLGSVKVLDPWGKASVLDHNRARFNPLALLSKDKPESVDIADLLAHSLVLQTGGDAHWSDSARALWKALLLHVATSDEFDGARDLIVARQILLAGFLPAKKSKEEKIVGGHAEGDLSTIESMIENDSFNGIISDFAMSLLATPEEERGSIISNAARQTDFLDTPALRSSLAANGGGELIDFAEWRRGIMSCFVCIPADKLEGSGQRWLRMVVSAALNEMTREENPPNLPVQFILDEIASLKRLEQVERAIGLAAGYGVQIWSVWQDISQMKDLYQSRWASFIGNAGARFIFGVGDYETAKYFSDFMGQGTSLVSAKQVDAAGIRASGQSLSVQARSLMTPDEIMMIDQREMLVLLDRMRPLKAIRVGWDEDSSMKSRSETGLA